MTGKSPAFKTGVNIAKGGPTFGAAKATSAPKGAAFSTSPTFSPAKGGPTFGAGKATPGSPKNSPAFKAGTVRPAKGK